MNALSIHTVDVYHPFSIPSFVAKLLAGTAITLGLFVLMAKLIENDAELSQPTQLITIDPIVFQEPEQHTIVKTPIQPIQELEQPPKRELPNTTPIETKTEFGTQLALNNVIDTVRLKPNLSIAANGEARPIVRVNPNYPSEAARNGIEGWVQLGFTIETDGSVSDIQVLNSQPKRLFDREATRALKRWKYKPTIENGKPVKQTGLSVMLDFKLDS